jgi:hypothetical protein
VIMFQTRKPFFLCSCHDPAVDYNSCRRIVVEGGDPENASRPTRLCRCSIHCSKAAAVDRFGLQAFIIAAKNGNAARYLNRLVKSTT